MGGFDLVCALHRLGGDISFFNLSTGLEVEAPPTWQNVLHKSNTPTAEAV